MALWPQLKRTKRPKSGWSGREGLGQRGACRVGPNLGWVVSRFVSAYITCSRKAGWLEEEGASLIFTIYLPFI